MLVTTLQGVRDCVREANESTYICVDVETTGLDYIDDELIGIGLATSKSSWYIDLLEADIPLTFVLQTLAPLFELGTHILISHNTPFDAEFLYHNYHKYGLELNWFDTCLYWWDTLSMAALADENLIGVKFTLDRRDGTQRRVGALSLKALSKVFLGRDQGLWEQDFENWSVAERAEYGEADVRNCFDLAMVLAQYLQTQGLLEYYRKYVAPMSFVTVAMEMNGLWLDVPRLLELQEEVANEIGGYVKQLQEIMGPQREYVVDASNSPVGRTELAKLLMPLVERLPNKEEYLTAGGNVSTSRSTLYDLWQKYPDNEQLKACVRVVESPSNPRSYQQLAAYLERRGYRLPLTQTGNPSVSSDVLESLAKQHPEEALFEPLFKMRKLEKLRGTYIDTCLEMAWEDHTVHPRWHQAGTVTGRYSCSTGNNKEVRHKRGPALQTIPRPDTIKEAGWPYNPREWFQARPGKILCVADLSQAEVRMLAVVSQDPALKYAVNSGEDLHSSIAANVWGTRWLEADDKEKKILRSHTKMVTFGTMYGIGPGSLAERLDIEFPDAVKLLDDFYTAFPGVVKWKASETAKLSRHKYVTSLLGRRRSPVLIQKPPRVTAKPGTKQYEEQKLAENLWRAEFEAALKKSRFDPEQVSAQELEGRAQRQAINFMVQGSVAELINYGLWTLVKSGYTVCGQIHDEVIVELEDTPEQREALLDLLRRVYEVEIAGVQFKLDVAFGKAWAVGKE